MADEPGFVINGVKYAVPEQHTFSVDEYAIFHAWTGEHLETLIDDVPVNHQTLGAFMQIAYMRGNPNVKQHEARDAVGASNLMDAMESLLAATEEESASPPAVTPSEQEQNGSPGGTDESQNTSGTDSTTPSDTPANVHSLGGSPRSESAVFRSMTSAG